MKAFSKVYWFFGRSGAGKTTLARKLCGGLLSRDIPVIYLDGDDMRSSVCSDLKFDSASRLENHRRIAEIAGLLVRQDQNVIVSTMAPEYSHRDQVAKVLGERLSWIYIDAPLDICMARDPKGIYKRAQAGQIKQLIDYPFDAPRENERLHHINTLLNDEDQCFQAILDIITEDLNFYVI